MSRGSQDARAELLGQLARELRQLNALSASFFRAAAARIGVAATDMQVIESLAATGPLTAGQLADLTGLTTGAIAGILNRLEEAGLVRRERDPEDGRRVIVRLAPESEKLRELGPLTDLVGAAWEELAASYTDEQITLLVDFLRRSNAVARQEIAWLREPPQHEEERSSPPLGDLASGQLHIAGAAGLTLRAGGRMPELYRARFEGTVPEVKISDGVVTMRFPRRLWMLGWMQRTAEITLNTAIPWRIVIRGGAAEIHAELGGLDLTGLELSGGMSMIHLELPAPSGVVPVRVSGGASVITVRRPAGVPAKVHLKGWASMFVFDEQTFSDVGSDVRLRSPGYDGSAPGYDIEVSSSASMVTITTEA